MFRIEFTPEAVDDLRLLRKFDQQQIITAIDMKTITIPLQAVEVNEILAQARNEDVLVLAADGGEFMLTAVDDFDEEIARARRSDKLMALLNQRAKQSQTIPLEEVKRQLGLTD